MKQANEWIEWYVTTFRDVSTQESENRSFLLLNQKVELLPWASLHRRDYAETRISLDQPLINQPAATYFMRASRSHFREGIMQRVLLVMDVSLSVVM